MFNYAKKISIIFLTMMLIVSSLNVLADNELPQNKSGVELINVEKISNDIIQYSEYYSLHSEKQSATKKIVLLENANKKIEVGMQLEFDVEIIEDTIFEFDVSYKATSKSSCEFNVRIDNNTPFFEAQNMTIPTYWQDSDKARIDSEGNQFSPEQVISDIYVDEKFRDYSGEFEKPYIFYFSKGNHTITLEMVSGSCDVKALSLVPSEKISKYSDAVDLTKVKKSQKINSVIAIEGEKAFAKSAKTLIPLSDDGSADVNPASAAKTLLNYIGGSNWSSQNDTIVWKFKVKEDGYYNIGFLYRQKDVVGGVTYRNLKIDGNTPFEEANRVKFTYTSSWKYIDYTNANEEQYWIYLDKGEHTISLSVTSGDLADVYRQLKDVASDMGDLYIDITMVVGETVDTGRSYELFNQIPEFNERLKSSAKKLEKIVNDLEKLQEVKSGTTVSSIKNAIETLKKMYNNPYSAHLYISSFYTDYTNLSAMLSTITDMPLDIDRIFLIGKSSEFDDPTAGFFESVLFSVKRFLYSFTSEYQEKKSNKDSLTLWVNWGRDQTQVLDDLVQSEFSVKYGIDVNVRLVNATLIQAILAGSGPDLMLQMSRTEPVNLAMRGALVDLKQFDDFDEVMQRFTEDAEVPFTYKDGVYAMPDTMSFYLMFVRTDILEEMGLQSPETWEDFVYIMSLLQHKNLQVSLPYTQITDSGVVNAGVGGLSMYPTLLLQNGLSLYNKDLTASTLKEEAQIKVFSEWVELYTKYKMPKTMDFYNRFRLGTAPLGIAAYSLYTQLKVAAPEIEGRWSVALVPGVKQEDGSINRLVAGSGTGCSITKLSKNPDKAWEFLKWWTSAETQLKYSENLESVLGYVGRVSTSNIEALENMSWDEEMLETMKTQLDSVVQIPELPGGYYTARGIDQAFWNVVEQNKNPTDMMLEWGEIVNREITRKQREYSY